MASTGDSSLGGVRRVVISHDAWISEKRGMSKARDPKTGLLLSGRDSPTQSPGEPGNDSEEVHARARRLWRKRATPPAAPPR
jgi:hypothetical protein